MVFIKEVEHLWRLPDLENHAKRRLQAHMAMEEVNVLSKIKVSNRCRRLWTECFQETFA